MQPKETYLWLMENGGPVIRYRTATELMTPDKTLNLRTLQDDLLKCPQVKKWLNNCKPPFLLNQKLTRRAAVTRASMEIHSARDTALENTLGKLTDFGLKKGMPELDRRVDSYLRWLKAPSANCTQYLLFNWMRHEAVDFLARAGYIDEPEVRKLIQTRLDLVYDFTRRGDYNIYADPRNKNAIEIESTFRIARIMKSLTMAANRVPLPGA